MSSWRTGRLPAKHFYGRFEHCLTAAITYRCEAGRAPGSSLQTALLTTRRTGPAHHKQEKEEEGSPHHHGRRPQHTIVPLHPATRACLSNAKLKFDEHHTPNSHRTRQGRVIGVHCEDHAQTPGGPRSRPAQAVCSRRRLHTPVRSPRLGAQRQHKSGAYIRQGGVSPRRALPLRVIGGRSGRMSLTRPHMSLPAYIDGPSATRAWRSATSYTAACSRGRRVTRGERVATLSSGQEGIADPIDEGPDGRNR
ncbi:unnamed protein product [Trichogramma brassicae]|uniref:Uncharacterized protein n=1 Tax=Trichogramma brassicae TaxID=86971 RepID=A0A6H5I2F0_9HYME|nr:unnamed protein product [Trichogramma brassicae]